MIEVVDLWLLQHINGWIASSGFLSRQAILFNDLEFSSFLVSIVIVSLWFWTSPRFPSFFKYRSRVILIFLSFLPTYIIARICQKILLRSRPIGENIPLKIIGSPESWESAHKGFSNLGAFPSDHAALLFIMITITFSLNRKLGILCLVLGLYTSFLRIGLGYHWPSDILGGAILGTLVASTLLYFETRLLTRLRQWMSWIESHQKWSYVAAFVFLTDFGSGFKILRAFTQSVLRFKLFH